MQHPSPLPDLSIPRPFAAALHLVRSARMFLHSVEPVSKWHTSIQDPGMKPVLLQLLLHWKTLKNK